jgi:hypothetical protein
LDYITREGDGLKEFCENVPASYPAARAQAQVRNQPTAQTS